ncbi:MAG: hypothetical protein HUU28_06445 [Planctomycetaceae bacterium]|jgi:hypothetical protein|nr:hypothetical protein [Planctomycetaceae bacterium]
MESNLLWNVLMALPGLLLHFGGILVFQFKFERLPQVRVLGTLGFGLVLAGNGSFLLYPLLFDAVGPNTLSLIGVVLRILSWTGLALVLFAIFRIPVHPGLQAGERD